MLQCKLADLGKFLYPKVFGFVLGREGCSVFKSHKRAIQPLQGLWFMRAHPQGEEKVDSAWSKDTTFLLSEYFFNFNGHDHETPEDSLLDITLLNEDSNT